MRLFHRATSRGHFSPTEEFFCFVFGFFMLLTWILKIHLINLNSIILTLIKPWKKIYCFFRHQIVYIINN